MYEEATIKGNEWGEQCWARIFALFRENNLQRLQSMHEDLTEEEEMKRQRRMTIMKDITKKTRSRARMDAENRWWVAELLGADCEKAWLHPREEESMQKWYAWLKRIQKEDEKRKMEEMHQQKGNKCGRHCFRHKITKPIAWRGGAQILKKEEEDAMLLCGTKWNVAATSMPDDVLFDTEECHE